jgi:ABC-type nitrate/sulfonate/bicarbonate transport system ATPase subunit
VEALLLGTKVALMTAGPSGRIKREIEVTLSYPRSSTAAEFVELVRLLEKLLQEEVAISRAAKPEN